MIDSDYGELLAAYAALRKKQRWFGPLKMLATLAAAFLGAGWTANAYLGQLATKDDVAKLLKGQDEKLERLDARITILGERETRTETRVEDLRGTMKIKP